MSFAGFLLAAVLYLTLAVIFVSIFLHVLSFRFRSHQNQMLYYPEMPPESREICEDPVALGIPNSERVVVMTTDKVRLRGFMLWPGPVAAAHRVLNTSDLASPGVMTSPISDVAPVPLSVAAGGSDVLASKSESVVPAVALSTSSATNTASRVSGSQAGAVPSSSSSTPFPPSTVNALPSVPGASPTFVVLYFHGNAGNVGHRLSLAQAFVSKLKCAVMMIDYRGFGLSDDAEPVQEGLELDAQACFDYLWQDHRVPRDRIVVMGTSLGGAVAIHLAANEKYARRILAVIVENTFTSVSDMASALGRPILAKLVTQCPGCAIGVFEYYVKPLALRIGWYNIRRVRRVVAPMLFLSGGLDELVPPEQMRTLYKESTRCLRDGNNNELTVPLRRFEEFESGMHNNLPLMPGYMTVIQRFVTDVTNGTTSGVV